MIRKHAKMIFVISYFLLGFLLLFDIIIGRKSVPNPLLACFILFVLGIGWSSI